MNKQRSWFILFFLIPTGIVFFSGNVLAQNIVTGDATSITVICNDVNNTGGEGPCTPTPTPTPPPTATPTPTSTPEPTPTPTSAPSNGGGDNQQQGGGNGGGGTGGASTSAPAPQGEVLGLSAASGESTVEILFYALGLLCLAAGFGLTRHPKKLHV